jgi:hypothetical protein
MRALVPKRRVSRYLAPSGSLPSLAFPCLNGAVLTSRWHGKHEIAGALIKCACIGRVAFVCYPSAVCLTPTPTVSLALTLRCVSNRPPHDPWNLAKLAGP